MRIALAILGTEILAIEVAHGREHQEQPEQGPPFGFSGSGGGQVERDDWPIATDALRKTARQK